MVSALVLVLVPSLAIGADSFFKGKTIRFVVGFSPGGGFDTYTRFIARHFGKHVPGNPRTVVQNRTGAGSMIAANYIYNRAKPDGLTVGNWIGPLVLQHVLGKKGIKFDGRKFNWLGVPSTDDNTCRAHQGQRHQQRQGLVKLQAADQDRRYRSGLDHR